LTINSDISYFESSAEGVLTAETTELSRTNKLTTYEVSIKNERGSLLAKVRLTFYITAKEIVF